MNNTLVYQQGKITSFQWYLLGISFLFCSVSLLFFERILINGGLGWDGVTYYKMALNFQEKLIASEYSSYYLKRSVPSALVYYFLNIINEVRALVGLIPVNITPHVVILCFSILNSLAIIFSNYYLFKIYNKFEFGKKLQITCFILFNLSFIIAKMPSYYPILTDHLGVFIAVSIFYAYLFSKKYFLLLLFFIGYFTFPTLFVMAGCLFIFPYNKTERQIPIISRKYIIYSIMIFISMLILIIIYKQNTFYNHLISKKNVFIDVLNGKFLLYGETPINTTLLPLAILLSFVYVITIIFYFNPIAILRQIIQQIKLKELFLITIIITILSQIISYYCISEGFSLPLFLINIVKQMFKEPLAFFFSHFFYFGILFIIPFIYHKYSKKALDEIGLGANLVLLFHLFLMLGSETRQFLAVFPIFIVLSGLIMKHHFIIDSKITIIIGVLSFLLSTVWLPINLTLSYKPLTIGMPYMYAIHQGPWMPSDFYYMVLIPICLSIMCILKLQLKIKTNNH